MRFRSLNLNLPQCSYGFASAWGLLLHKLKPSGIPFPGGVGHAFLYPDPGTVGPRWLIWGAGSGQYWNHRPDCVWHGMEVT
jgi:hypothetical protein